jgi:hypothetical protein
LMLGGCRTAPREEPVDRFARSDVRASPER